MKLTVAKELVKANYLSDVKVESTKPRNTLVILINQPGENSNITEITRLSSPGRRMYVGANEIPKVKSGRGMVLVSTSKGVMPGHTAVQQRLGGELLLKVY